MIFSTNFHLLFLRDKFFEGDQNSIKNADIADYFTKRSQLRKLSKNPSKFQKYFHKSISWLFWSAHLTVSRIKKLRIYKKRGETEFFILFILCTVNVNNNTQLLRFLMSKELLMLSCMLFWDDIMIFWDENLLLFTFLTGKLRKNLFWTNKKFVYLLS